MKVFNRINMALTLALALCGTAVMAQEAKEDTLTGVIEQLQSDNVIAKRLKFSGYVQAQYQKSDTVGSPSVAGGNFTSYDNRFQVRRARLKAEYTGEQTKVVLQIDLKDDGSVKVKEAYGMYTEPWLKTVSLTAGIFLRPFGQEVQYSSTSIETLERSRIMQTLFPDEQDMGAKITIQAPKNHPLNFIKIDAGLFSGNAINSETDNFKDFIGQISFKKSVLNDNLLLNGGVSYYNGGWYNGAAAASVYKWWKNPATNSYAFSPLNDNVYKKGDKFLREYTGFDLQANLSSAVGMTLIRGEYIFGSQPGTSKSSVSPKGIVNETAKEVTVNATDGKSYKVTPSGSVASDVYLRNFSGYYVMLAQRILQTKHEIVAKYDVYDPNTKVKGNDIGNGNKTGAADISFTTIGLGWNYYASANFKLTVYYDMVKNETSSSYKTDKPNGINDYRKDLKDNVLTIRAQYRF